MIAGHQVVLVIVVMHRALLTLWVPSHHRSNRVRIVNSIVTVVCRYRTETGRGDEKWTEDIVELVGWYGDGLGLLLFEFVHPLRCRVEEAIKSRKHGN